MRIFYSTIIAIIAVFSLTSVTKAAGIISINLTLPQNNSTFGTVVPFEAMVTNYSSENNLSVSFLYAVTESGPFIEAGKGVLVSTSTDGARFTYNWDASTTPGTYIIKARVFDTGVVGYNTSATSTVTVIGNPASPIKLSYVFSSPTGALENFPAFNGYIKGLDFAVSTNIPTQITNLYICPVESGSCSQSNSIAYFRSVSAFLTNHTFMWNGAQWNINDPNMVYAVKQGLFNVSVTAEDQSGNTVTDSSRYIRIDMTPPTIASTIPDQKFMQTTFENPTTTPSLTYPLASDDSSGVYSIVPSQTDFPVGTTTVTWTVTDNAGNKEIATSKVIITPFPLLTINTLFSTTTKTAEFVGSNLTGSRNLSFKLNGVSYPVSIGSSDSTLWYIRGTTIGTLDYGNYHAELIATSSTDGSELARATADILFTKNVNIALRGKQTVNIYRGGSYADPGADATDEAGHAITVLVSGFNNVRFSLPGNYDVGYTTDGVASPLTVTRRINILDLPAGTVLSGSSYNFTSTSTDLFLDDSAQDSILRIGQDSSTSTLNLSALITANGDTKTASLPSDLDIIDSEGNVLHLSRTLISGGSGWDGRFNLLQFLSTSTINASRTGYTANVEKAIEIGSNNNNLNLTGAARIKFIGKAGKLVGFVKNGTFNQITTQCSADTQTAGDAIPAYNDCYINVGSDLIVWTRHLSKYVIYTETANSGSNTNNDNNTTPPPGSRSSGGGGGRTYSQADANHDYKVDILDFVALMADWGKTGSNLAADFNSDQKVDIMDFVLLMANWTK